MPGRRQREGHPPALPPRAEVVEGDASMKHLILSVAMLAIPAGAQVRPPDAGFPSGPKIDPAKARAYNPPKTADGHPDFEGIWQPRAGGAAYSILPHPAGFFLGAGSDTGIVEGG